MRERYAHALLAVACGAIAREPSGCSASRPVHSPSAPAPSVSARAGDDRARSTPAAEGSAASLPPSSSPFAALSALGAAAAAGMHEVARRENGGERIELARADARDVCVRVAYGASAPVTAKLLDADGNVLAETDAPRSSALLGATGPVCIRKGGTVSATARSVDPDASNDAGPEAGAARVIVRWVAWSSP